MNEAGCECGAVRFVWDGDSVLTFCHCGQCRRMHGGPFAPFPHTRLRSFEWRAGEEAIRHYASSAEGRRAFCAHCGTVLPIVLAELGYAAIPASLVDAPFDPAPAAHFFVGSKAPWYTIADDAPRYDTVPEGGVPAFLARLSGA